MGIWLLKTGLLWSISIVYQNNRDKKCHHSLLKMYIPLLAFFLVFYLLFWCAQSIYKTKNTLYNVQARDGETMASGMDMTHNIASYEPWPHNFFHIIRQHGVLWGMRGCQKFLKSLLDPQYFFTGPLCIFCLPLCLKWTIIKNASVSTKLNVESLSRRRGALLPKY